MKILSLVAVLIMFTETTWANVLNCNVLGTVNLKFDVKPRLRGGCCTYVKINDNWQLVIDYKGYGNQVLYLDQFRNGFLSPFQDSNLPSTVLKRGADGLFHGELDLNLKFPDKYPKIDGTLKCDETK